MSEYDELVIDGVAVRFVPSDTGGVSVLAGGTDIGSIAPVAGGPGYIARGTDGEALTRASQWGGPITARYGSRELAVRALLSISRA